MKHMHEELRVLTFICFIKCKIPLCLIVFYGQELAHVAAQSFSWTNFFAGIPQFLAECFLPPPQIPHDALMAPLTVSIITTAPHNPTSSSFTDGHLKMVTNRK